MQLNMVVGDMPSGFHNVWLQTMLEQTRVFLIELMYCACVCFSNTVSSVELSGFTVALP